MSEVFAESDAKRAHDDKVDKVELPKVDDDDELGDEETSWQWKWISNLYGMLIAMFIDTFWDIVELRKNRRAIFCLSIVLEFFTLLTTPLLLLCSWFAPKGDILDLIYKFVPFRTLNLPSRIADTRMDAPSTSPSATASSVTSTGPPPVPVVSILLIHGSSFNWTQWMFGIFHLVREWMRSGRVGRWRLFVVNYNSVLNLLPFNTSTAKQGIDDYARGQVRDKIRNDIFPDTCRYFVWTPNPKSGSVVHDVPQVDFATEADRQLQQRLDLAGRKPEDMPQNRLVLIGHGVGGLIAQEYVNAVAAADGVQILGIFTLATPWFGLKLLEYRDQFFQSLSSIISPNKRHGKFVAGSKLDMQLRSHSLFCTQMRNSTNSSIMTSAHGNIKSPNDLVVEFPVNENLSISYASSTSHHPDGRILSHTNFGAHLGHYSILASPAVWVTISQWLNSIAIPSTTSTSTATSSTITSATESSDPSPLLPDRPSSSSTSSADGSTATAAAAKSNALSLD